MSKRKITPSAAAAEETFYRRISRSCLQRGWVVSDQPSHITINVESLVGQIAITQSGKILTNEQVIAIERQISEAIFRAMSNAERAMASGRIDRQSDFDFEKWFEGMYKRLLKRLAEEESQTNP